MTQPLLQDWKELWPLTTVIVVMFSLVNVRECVSRTEHGVEKLLHAMVNWWVRSVMFLLCLFIAIICPPLAYSPYGPISYSPNTSPYLFGTQATYTVPCPPGEERRGGDDLRICFGNGHSTVGMWTGTAPICAGWQCTMSVFM